MEESLNEVNIHALNMCISICFPKDYGVVAVRRKCSKWLAGISTLMGQDVEEAFTGFN